jgi:hypothetical protein
MKLLVAALVLALALPMSASVVNTDASLQNTAGDVLPWGLGLQGASDDACKYNVKTGAPPDTLTTGEPDKVYLLFGPDSPPLNCFVQWVGETNVVYGWVQFKERAIDSDTYTWGDIVRVSVPGAVTKQHEFKHALWESVRAWGESSTSEGLMTINVYCTTIE